MVKYWWWCIDRQLACWPVQLCCKVPIGWCSGWSRGSLPYFFGDVPPLISGSWWPPHPPYLKVWIGHWADVYWALSVDIGCYLKGISIILTCIPVDISLISRQISANFLAEVIHQCCSQYLNRLSVDLSKLQANIGQLSTDRLQRPTFSTQWSDSGLILNWY